MAKLLVGNKSDLEGDRVVPLDAAKSFADENQLAFIETSAKTGVNVRDAFVRMVQVRIFFFFF